METNALFMIAARNKYRFPYKGLISAEDLWDLSPQALDGVFKELNSQLKKHGEESLLSAPSKEVSVLENKIEIIKIILNMKLREKASREQAHANAQQRQHIMEIIASKDEEELRSKSVDELRKMLSEIPQ